MKNQKFNEAIDEIVGFIVDVNKLQMDQLKCNIKAVHEANTHEVDPHTIAKMILDTPVKLTRLPANTSDCEGCTGCGETHKIVRKDPVVEEGQYGDVWDLTRIQNEGNVIFGFDFYHHCPEVQDEYVRLNYFDDKIEFKCPLCNETFMSKMRPKAFHK